MGQMEMKCIFDIEKNISIWAKVTQMSDVAHGLLVFFMLHRYLYSITCVLVKLVFSLPPTRVRTMQFQLYSLPCSHEKQKGI
jgi:hypothetical protein